MVHSDLAVMRQSGRVYKWKEQTGWISEATGKKV